MSRIFAILGKLILGAIFLIAILTVGYHVGTNKNLAASSPQMTNTSDIASSPTPTMVLDPTKTVTIKMITGGLTEDTGFQKYRLEVPEDWHEKREIIKGVSEKVTLSKKGYSLTMYQAPMDGSMCLYNDGTLFDGPSQTYTYFEEIKAAESVFRRSFQKPETDTHSQTVCEKQKENFVTPTKFGAISIIVPLPADEAMIAELDEIVGSIRKN